MIYETNYISKFEYYIDLDSKYYPSLNFENIFDKCLIMIKNYYMRGNEK